VVSLAPNLPDGFGGAATATWNVHYPGKVAFNVPLRTDELTNWNWYCNTLSLHTLEIELPLFVNNTEDITLPVTPAAMHDALLAAVMAK